MSSNLERTAGRRKQTRLMFDPVDGDKSSSPVVKMSPARVRYQLPTPVKSSQTQSRTRILPDNLDTTDDDDLPIISSSRRQRHNEGTSTSRTAEKDRAVHSEDDETDVEDDYLRMPRKKKQATRVPGPFKPLAGKPKKKTSLILPVDSDGEEDELALPSRKPKQRTRVPVEDSDDEDVQVSNTRSRKRHSVVIQEDEDDDEVQSPAASSARRASHPVFVEDDEDDDELPVLPTRSRRVSAYTGKINGKAKQTIELSDDDDVVVTSPSKRRRSVPIPDDEEESDGDIISPLKRRKPAVESDDSDISPSPPKRSRPVRVEEDEDEDSDLPSPSRITTSARRAQPASKAAINSTRSTRQSKPRRKRRSAKEKAAELLRRKRAGEKIDELSDSSDDEEESSQGVYDSNPEFQALEHFEDEELGPEEVEEAASSTSRRRANRRDSLDDEEQDDFIVDDDEDGPLGVPLATLEIPLQFTQLSHKPLKDNFTDCVEWLVHNRIDPDFPDRHQERYKHAFRKVDDEARGYATSSFISSQWTREFTVAMKGRPLLASRQVEDGEGYTAEGVPKCDACNHRNHPPKQALSFYGKPYVRDSLEDVEQDSDYEDDDENAIEIDENGIELPPVGNEFFSGRDCAEKASIANKLIHWKYYLNEAVTDILDEEDHLTDAKIAEREEATSDARWMYADSLVEAWRGNGTVTNLYREFKKMMDTARTYEPRRYGRGRSDWLS